MCYTSSNRPKCLRCVAMEITHLYVMSVTDGVRAVTRSDTSGGVCHTALSSWGDVPQHLPCSTHADVLQMK